MTTPPFYPSSPIEIRDGTTARIAALGIFQNVYKARTQPTKDDQLPLACVWNAGERTQPNGDGNTGAPEFIHTMTLAVDVMTKAGDETTLDADIISLVERVRAGLMSDSTWIALFEGIERCDTRYSYPKETNDFLVQAIIEIEVTFRSVWQPLTPNDLKQIAIFAEPQRPRVTCVYCHTPNTGDRTVCRLCNGALPKPPDPVTVLINFEDCAS